MQQFGLPFWKRMPFVRLLLPFMAGIIVQYHLNFSVVVLASVFLVAVALVVTARFFTTSKRFFLGWIAGAGFHLILFCAGAVLNEHRNIENDVSWIERHYQKEDAVLVVIQEPLVEKPRSYKAVARIEMLLRGDSSIPVKGNMLLYFQKDSMKPAVEYGSAIILHNPLQAVNNSGNPGAFDYRRYCSFQNIYHQAFLKPGDYTFLSEKHTQWFKSFLISSRQSVLQILRKYIINKNELAVGEALLIGYRDDLDMELVQSYSNAGVVHIIAISGLHLGMIYAALVWLFRRFKKVKWKSFVQPAAILIVLWLFTFIAGAVPSVLRSAVMFTCIVLGESLSRRTSVYNTLAATAFILLLINPFYLWDAGFQLSFAAVLSIISFQHYISNWFYFQNKLMERIWQISAVTLSAQVLTLPVVLYHFHQFPNFFMITNLIIVPLSGLILFAEMFLLVLSFIPFIAQQFGKAVEWLLWLMNIIIDRTDRIPYAVTDGILITIPQIIFIFATIILASVWLIKKNKQMFYLAAASFLCYLGLRSIDILGVTHQQKIIVYNVPKHTAIDVVEGGTYTFIGDAVLLQDGFLKNFHLKPSRIINRIDKGVLKKVSVKDNIIEAPGTRVIIVDKALSPEYPQQKIQADVVILTKNPRLYISQLLMHYDCKMLVFDASNPLWKVRLWKKDCDSLHLPHHSVPEQGAFEMDL